MANIRYPNFIATPQYYYTTSTGTYAYRDYVILEEIERLKRLKSEQQLRIEKAYSEFKDLLENEFSKNFKLSTFISGNLLCLGSIDGHFITPRLLRELEDFLTPLIEKICKRNDVMYEDCLKEYSYNRTYISFRFYYEKCKPRISTKSGNVYLPKKNDINTALDEKERNKGLFSIEFRF